MLQVFRTPALSPAATARILSQAVGIALPIRSLSTEWCYYAQPERDLSAEELNWLNWFLAETFEPQKTGSSSYLGRCRTVLEVGSRLSFETAWSSTAVGIFNECGLPITRIERSIRFGLDTKLTERERETFLAPLYDRMTQMPYEEALVSFDTGIQIPPVRVIPLLEEGKKVLQELSWEMGFGWDEQDLDMLDRFFRFRLVRNPTDVELFQLAQANSEHSRHPFFKGKLVIDGETAEHTLMEIVKSPWINHPGNSVIAFNDDSSAILGGSVGILIPYQAGRSSPLVIVERILHPTLTAETHNHPSGIEPYAGAATGSGGRIRDNISVGRGAQTIAGGAAYCIGNLHIPGYELPWEHDGWSHQSRMASPLDILIRASDGASDYGNCYGEPLVYGFVRTFGLTLRDDYRAWFKPVVYVVGAGQMDEEHTKKGKPEKGMLVVQIGGPAYRIGLGGGSASSMVTGENLEELDFSSVQRGDPEMEQRVYRVIRACIELGSENPIISVHDLGAGGDCNALPEIVEPAGAKLSLREIPVGDKTLSALEIWGNESQEREALLIQRSDLEGFKEICLREGVPVAALGEITGDGKLVVWDEQDGSSPVNLPLKEVLGEIPQKTHKLQKIEEAKRPFIPPANMIVAEALGLVLRLPSVASKRYLTTKVDRSVGGLIAQQQCVGSNQLTLSDYAVISQSHFDCKGVALSLGEQPIKGLVSPQAMARLAVAESLLNLAGVKITGRTDIRCSANWMWAAKLPGEGARLRDAALAMAKIMEQLEIAVDGGKDSLSMAAVADGSNGKPVTVKAPGELVIASYVTVNDVTCKATPDLKKPGNSLLLVDLSAGNSRLGGSALAQCYSQVGNDCPDVEDSELLAVAFDTVQVLLGQGLISSLHDRSDGGLITTILEMSFAGNVGLQIDLDGREGPIPSLFNEELGLVIETDKPDEILNYLGCFAVPVKKVGTVGQIGGNVVIRHKGEVVLESPMVDLRNAWEETSMRLDRLQANPDCVVQEASSIRDLVTPPPFRLTFDLEPTLPEILVATAKPKVAVIRERGSNGDREMAASFFAAGFEPWDVTMSDLTSGNAVLSGFQGAAFVGGFSFGDTLDAGKGWAGVVRFNERARETLASFYARGDTFSLGVCNGCQLVSLMGWLLDLPDEKKPRFIRNSSERFESRFVTVEILPSPSIFLKGMEGSRLGIWVAHAEGRLHVPDQKIFERINNGRLAPIRFIDPFGEVTQTYPFNPNGSPEGITALCSPDGRHLAMMPHPERLANQLWQWPWLPDEWKSLKASPWLQLFQNAYRWCRQV
jgi:phosphoribosylformylglycinamidine synthase